MAECGYCKSKGNPGVQVRSQSPVLAFHRWKDFHEGKKNRDQKKKPRLRVTELAQKEA